MSGNDSVPRRAGATRATLAVLIVLALLGGAGWRLLHSAAEPRRAAAAAASLAEGASGAGATVVVQAPGATEPAPPPPAPPPVVPAGIVQDQPPPAPVAAVQAPAQQARGQAAQQAPAPAAPPKRVQEAPAKIEPPPAPATLAQDAPASVEPQAPAGPVAQAPVQAPQEAAQLAERDPEKIVPQAPPKVERQPPAKPAQEAPAKLAPPAAKLAEREPEKIVPQAPPKVEPQPPAKLAQEVPAKVKQDVPAKLTERGPEKIVPDTPAQAAPQVAESVAAPAPAGPAAKAVPLPPIKVEAPVVAPQTGAANGAPSFDIVRIGPQGDAVVAGRAAPNADVRVLDNGREIARTQADDSGQWVVLPDKPLPSGGQELTLAAREQGKPELAGDAPVVLLVPAKHTGATAATPAEPESPATALAVLTPPDAAPRLLQAPVPAEPAPAVTGKIAGKVGLDVVDYDDRGAIRFAGTGAPGSRVRLYVDDVAVGDAIVDPLGRWGLVPTATVTAGDHRLRVDDLGIRGQVMARVELPFQRARLSPQEVPDARVVVQPRQNLWRIARHAYGLGMRYTVIYEANRDQIRDPNRIYPGQVFAIPSALDALAPAGPTSAPSSASTSR